MDTRLNRRSIMALMADAAALPIAAVTPSSAQAASTEPTASTEPDISEIPGLDQFRGMYLMAIVTTYDGRSATAHLVFNGAGQVEIRHAVADGYFKAQLPVGGLESLPTWLQQEIGYATLTATDPREHL